MYSVGDNNSWYIKKVGGLQLIIIVDNGYCVRNVRYFPLRNNLQYKTLLKKQFSAYNSN